MRIHRFLAIAGLSALMAAPLHAQSIKKVGSEIHHTLKTAGNDVKSAAGDVASSTHHELQKAGNGTKTTLGNATGIHKVGGSVGQAAQAVSHTSKKVGRTAKHSLKKSTSHAHRDLKKTGNDVKASVKNPND